VRWWATTKQHTLAKNQGNAPVRGIKPNQDDAGVTKKGNKTHPSRKNKKRAPVTQTAIRRGVRDNQALQVKGKSNRLKKSPLDQEGLGGGMLSSTKGDAITGGDAEHRKNQKKEKKKQRRVLP